MIIANQEIALHLAMVRNLTGLTSGRFMIRLGLHEVTPQKKKAATPFNLVQKQPGKHQNRSQFDERFYTSRMFFLKSGMNVQLNQICIFKLNSPFLDENERICNIKIVCQLIHIDYSKSKVVSACELTVNERCFHSYLEMNFYEGGPCQIVGTMHSCLYKFQFFTDKDAAIDLKGYAQMFSKSKIEQIADYLSNEGNHAYKIVASHYTQLMGKEPEVVCSFPEKEDREVEQKEESREESRELSGQFQKVQTKTEKVIPITFGVQKRERKKLFATPPENIKTQAEQRPETDPNIVERKKRKRIFHTTSKQLKYQKVFNNQKLLHENAQKIYQIWRQIIDIIFKEEGSKYFTAKSVEFKKKVTERVGESVIRFKGSPDVDMFGHEEQMRNKLAYQLRNQDRTFYKQIKQAEENIFPVLDDSFFTPERPIFFEELAVVDENNKIVAPVQVLVIMVHGLGACRLDMEKLKAEMRRYYDFKVKVYISNTNQARTEGDIQQMGQRLAGEVDYELTKYSDIPKICFLGHSMGGLIIRSALPRLQKYKNYFHAMVTLSSPHLGFLYSNSTLVDAGLWFINTMKKCTSIEQMTMQDNQDLKQTFIYKLSKQKGLEWFKRLVFLGSHQDHYVPFYSARVQKHKDSILDNRNKQNRGVVYCKMVQNLLDDFKGEIIRLNVNFSTPEQNIDNLIGRAAHISFINSVQMIRTFVIAGPHYFF